MAGKELIVACRMCGEHRERPGAGLAGVAECDESVSLQPARIVARDIEAPQQVVVEPVLVVEDRDEIDVRGGIGRAAGAPAFDSAIPGADVLADVASVELRAERLAVGLGNRLRHLCPVGEAAGCVENARLVERAGRTGIDAAGAGAATRRHRRRRLELRGGDERPEDDPRAVPLRDQQRVLPVEADPGARRRFAVDMLIRVDEHPVGRLERPAECIELLAQLGVAVVPGITRQPAVAGWELGLGQVIAEGRRDDGAGSVDQVLGMARDLGPGGGEAETPEEAAGFALADIAFGSLVRLGGSHTDGVEPELGRHPLHLGGGHRLHCYSGSRKSL